MSAAVRMKPLGSTQQLHWAAKELDAVALLFGLAVMRCDYVHLLYILCGHAYFSNNKRRG